MSLWTISVLPIGSSFFNGLKVSARGILFLEIGKSEVANYSLKLYTAYNS